MSTARWRNKIDILYSLAIWSVDVSGNWRLTFVFEGEAILVDYQDYH